MRELDLDHSGGRERVGEGEYEGVGGESVDDFVDRGDCEGQGAGVGCELGYSCLVDDRVAEDVDFDVQGGDGVLEDNVGDGERERASRLQCMCVAQREGDCEKVRVDVDV